MPAKTTMAMTAPSNAQRRSDCFSPFHTSGPPATESMTAHLSEVTSIPLISGCRVLGVRT